MLYVSNITPGGLAGEKQKILKWEFYDTEEAGNLQYNMVVKQKLIDL